MYLSLEKNPVNIQFWEAMQVVCQHHLALLRDPDRAVGGAQYNAEVDASASQIVTGLSISKLDALEQRTRDLLSGGGAVDSEFWALVLDKIAIARAQNRLAGIHEIVLRNRLELFKKRQREDAARAQADLADGEEGEDVEEAYEADEEDYVEPYERDMSPVPMDLDAVVRDADLCHLPIVDEADMLRSLYEARHTISNKAYMPKVARAEPVGQVAEDTGPPAGPSPRTGATQNPSTTWRRATWPPACKRPSTTGATASARGSRGTSTAFTPGTSGRSTTRATTTLTIPRPRLCRGTSSISSTPT